MKKIARMMAALLLMLVCVAIAEERSKVYISGEFEYILLEDGTAEICSFVYEGEFSCAIIPDELNGYPVTSIGDYAFYGCSSLEEICIPDSVTSMGFNPFTGCEKLKEIKVSPEHPIFASIDGVLFNKTEKKLICYPEAIEENEYAIPDGILVIGESAFADCKLKEILIPDSVTVIEDNAFWSASFIREITIPGSVTSIGGRAFYACDYIILRVERNSYAEQYVKEYDYEYAYTDALDWLNS